MAPIRSTDLFRGNGTAEKAHTWLRTLKGTWKFDAEDRERLYKFENALHPGGQAEEWWNCLKETERKDWTLLMAAFEVKWLKPRITGRTQDVVLAELQNNVLERESLGKYVEDEDGTNVL